MIIAQLVEQRTGNAEVTGSNPVEALIFFRLLLSNCLNWKIYCDDHSSLSFCILLTILNDSRCFLKTLSEIMQVSRGANAQAPLAAGQFQGKKLPKSPMKSKREFWKMQQREERLQRQLKETQQCQERSQRLLTAMEQQLENSEIHLVEIQQREENSQRQLREVQQREENLQRQLREMQQREENSQRQLREVQQREENLQRQLREMQERKENSQRQLREVQQRKENSQRQLREMQQREENSQRQLREVQQREENLQRQLREIQQRESSQEQVSSLERQLTEKDQEINELELSLSLAQQTIIEQRRPETCDWVIFRHEIQMTENCLGRGGWGSVNEGIYCGCTVAVKQIHDLILSPHNRVLFEREMNVASACRHPCLLQFIGATNDEASPLFVTELMEKSLRDLLVQQQPSETEIAVISLDVASALNYLHQKKPDPIIHRDVSSANVLLWRQGDQWRAKVSDYGTANFMKHTMTAAPGNRIYSAPEALSSNQTPKVGYHWFHLVFNRTEYCTTRSMSRGTIFWALFIVDYLVLLHVLGLSDKILSPHQEIKKLYSREGDVLDVRTLFFYIIGPGAGIPIKSPKSSAFH